MFCSVWIYIKDKDWTAGYQVPSIQMSHWLLSYVTSMWQVLALYLVPTAVIGSISLFLDQCHCYWINSTVIGSMSLLLDQYHCLTPPCDVIRDNRMTAPELKVNTCTSRYRTCQSVVVIIWTVIHLCESHTDNPHQGRGRHPERGRGSDDSSNRLASHLWDDPDSLATCFHGDHVRFKPAQQPPPRS